MQKKPETQRPTLLLADDDRQLLESMGSWLDEQGFEVLPCSQGKQACQLAKRHQPSLALIDLRLGNEDGMQVLRDVRRLSPGTSAIIMTGYGSPDMAVEALQAGAFDFLTKPLLDEELLTSLERALNQQQVLAENQSLRKQLDNRQTLQKIVGSDVRLRRTFEIVESVADTRATILITGESGTGKSMLAHAIHQRSDRREGPFVEVACGALPENLLESELFGHVAGSFTGATGNREGKFKLADGGTLFLDEIGTASPALQVKLLRVLQEFAFEQVGGTKTFRVNTRVILATNEDLAAAVAASRFREDLYYRVNIINLQMPALRERSSDIPALASHFLEKLCRENGRQFEGFEHSAMNLLQSYRWPGNVRELQNAIERAVLLGKGPRIVPEDLPPTVSGSLPSFAAPVPGPATAIALPHHDPASGPALMLPSPRGKTLREALEEPERQIILQTLKDNNWSRTTTAEVLGINRTTLYKKMRKLGLDHPRYACVD